MAGAGSGSPAGSGGDVDRFQLETSLLFLDSPMPSRSPGTGFSSVWDSGSSLDAARGH